MKFLLAAVIALSPVVAPADSIDYASGGSIHQHTATVTGAVKAGSTWGVKDELLNIDDETTGVDTQGQLGKVTISTGTLSVCAQGLCFTGGSVDIVANSGAVLLDDTFISGVISKSHRVTFLNATFNGGGTVEIESQNGVFSSNTVFGATVHEPATLTLLASGLLGLSFMRRWLH